jgi:2'-hydroxyisoflavone reductase
MSTSRREFLQVSAAAAAALLTQHAAAAAREQAKPASSKLKLLVLGGTGFIGPALVELAQKRGHSVTIFNRGKTRPGLFPDVEKLQGDRDPKKDQGLKSLEGRKWDVVFDDCGYYPRHVKASAELMAPNIGHYVYVSSISCYAKNDVEGGTEDAELAKLEDPAVETMGAGGAYYGGLKVLCEQAAQAAMPGKTTIVRPGYIVGPDDSSGRFTYWPVRIDKGGDVLVPGDKSDPIQVIDVRDLAAWMLLVGEQGTKGVFNACGPEQRLSWGDVIAACQKCAGAPSKLHWATTAELKPFADVEFPIWAPYESDSKGFHTWSNARAVKAGLRFRPIEEIAKDTLAWWKTVAADDRRKKLAGPAADKEQELLKALKKI